MKSTMALKHITHERCPTCGARIQGLYHESIHCSGEHFEHVKFKCGSKIKYIPNFSREQIVTACPNHPDEIKRDEADSEALENLEKYVNKSKLSEEKKKRILRDISFMVSSIDRRK